MIRVSSIWLNRNNTKFNSNEAKSTPYQLTTIFDKSKQLSQDTVSFGSKLPRTRLIHKFIPSENFITKKLLTVNIKKILPDGTQIQTAFKRGKKSFELKVFANNSYSSSEYDRSGKLIQTNNEYYDQNNRLIKDELIDSEGTINFREYLPNGKINKECTTYSNGVKATQYYNSNGGILKLVQESTDGMKVTRHYDTNGVVREKIIITGSQSAHYKYDNQQKLISLKGSSKEPDGSVIKTTYDTKIDKPIPASLIKEMPDGTYMQVEFSNGKMAKLFKTTKNEKNEIISTETLYNEEEAVVKRSQKFPDNTEYVDNYSKDGKYLESQIKISQVNEITELRREIFYNKSGKPDHGVVLENGVVTLQVKYDEHGTLCEVRDAEGNIIALNATNMLALAEGGIPTRKVSEWVKVDSLEDVIPDLELFNKISAN